MRSAHLRVGVSPALLELEPTGGHGKVWHRVLRLLETEVRLLALGSRRARRLGRRPGRPDVLLADGHAQLPDQRDAPLVVQVHEAGWHEPSLRDLLDPAFHAGIAHFTELAIRAADRLITPSQAVRRDIARDYGLDLAKVHAVAHGVDPLFTPGLPGGRELVARARGRDLQPYVLYAASLHPRKNLAAVREGMAAIAARGFPHALAIAGMPAPDRADSGPLIAAARAELPDAPGRVAYLGQVPDSQLASLMAGADAYCLPSLYEGFGLTALEAMACGTAVVVSDRGALAEVVGETGVMVEPTGEAVGPALVAVLSDPERGRALGRAAAQRARGFTWERTAQGWLRALLDAAGSS